MPHGTFYLGLVCVVREAGGWGVEGFLEVGSDGFFGACLEIFGVRIGFIGGVHGF